MLMMSADEFHQRSGDGPTGRYRTQPWVRRVEVGPPRTFTIRGKQAARFAPRAAYGEETTRSQTRDSWSADRGQCTVAINSGRCNLRATGKPGTRNVRPQLSGKGRTLHFGDASLAGSNYASNERV